eukprot:6072606-Lingulodinium_polyedra.AAC.1
MPSPGSLPCPCHAPAVLLIWFVPCACHAIVILLLRPCNDIATRSAPPCHAVTIISTCSGQAIAMPWRRACNVLATRSP